MFCISSRCHFHLPSGPLKHGDGALCELMSFGLSLKLRMSGLYCWNLRHLEQSDWYVGQLGQRDWHDVGKSGWCGFHDQQSGWHDAELWELDDEEEAGEGLSGEGWMEQELRQSKAGGARVFQGVHGAHGRHEVLQGAVTSGWSK